MCSSDLFVLAELDRSLIFPSVEYTNYVLMKSANVWARGRLPVVLDGQHIMFADYSAAQVGQTRKNKEWKMD